MANARYVYSDLIRKIRTSLPPSLPPSSLTPSLPRNDDDDDDDNETAVAGLALVPVLAFSTPLPVAYYVCVSCTVHAAHVWKNHQQQHNNWLADGK